MRAMVYHRYGDPDVLELEEVEKPTPGDEEVVLRVCAASLNPMDWRIMKGKPYFFRLFFGLRKPKRGRPGVDIAGVVEAVGRNVKGFEMGDALFGMGQGALAEYACASSAKLARKPANVTFEQAAALGVAGLTALQGLRKGKVQAGQTVLVNGAAGGCGTFAVQIAKWMGAKVTGVCSTNNLEMVRSIGADQAIDYTQEDFTKRAERYAVIFDCMANHPPSEVKQILAPQGICVTIGGPRKITFVGLLSGMIRVSLISAFGKHKFVSLFARANKPDLELLGQLTAAGTIRPVIDRRYPLGEGREALWYLEAGHARGKVLVLPN